ncbi:MAG: hypothetical protein KKD28_14915 [Chloroflexi bacterium]|nr:hypothetical protein [Chloroflexota bacterium]MBU1662752.1 hypothetical protein [Chloroflexota bacterium]
MVEESQIASFVSHFDESDADCIAFSWNGKHAAEFHDANHDFRAAVTEYVLRHSGDASIGLLRALFKAHAEYSVEAWSVSLNFGDLGALLLSRGGTDVVDDFASGFVATFDTYGACHQMSIDVLTLRHLSQYVAGELEGEPSEERRRKLEAAQHLFGKLKNGTAHEGWVVLQPGTAVSNIRSVGGTRLAWLRIKGTLRRLLSW